MFHLLFELMHLVVLVYITYHWYSVHFVHVPLPGRARVSAKKSKSTYFFTPDSSPDEATATALQYYHVKVFLLMNASSGTYANGSIAPVYKYNIEVI